MLSSGAGAAVPASAATEVTFHLGSARRAHRCATNAESLGDAARHACGLAKDAPLRLLRGGMQLDPTTPAVLLGGCAVLVMGQRQESRLADTDDGGAQSGVGADGGIARLAAVVPSLLLRSLRHLRWYMPLDGWRQRAWGAQALAVDYIRTIFVDVDMDGR
jgi:hypothetical protein